MGHFSSFAEFVQMGQHGLYVWLSYGLALLIFAYNIAANRVIKQQFFINAKRQLRREQEQAQ